jgi:hypothetical protein
MAASTVRVRGLRELQRDFAKVSSDLKRELRSELKEVAEPVAESARQKIDRYRGARTASIRPRVTARSAFVTQGARKVTGLRGDFGALQMRRLGEALDENKDEVVQGLERMLDRLASSNGF